MNYFGIKPKKLFQWGMKAIIFPPMKEVESEWKDLKDRVFNDKEVVIRGYGRDAHGTQLFIDFYRFVFNNSHVKKDSTNNYKPQTELSPIYEI